MRKDGKLELLKRDCVREWSWYLRSTKIVDFSIMDSACMVNDYLIEMQGLEKNGQ